ncbi:MAG: hypothetical protein DSY32_03170 [Aquifex sp.]|nr:MAG: hypothetical protein DSY32_03170 [Aquifex sp.]
MSVNLVVKRRDLDFLTLEAVNREKEFPESPSDYEELFPEITLGFDKEGNVTYFHVDLWAGPDFLDDIISYFESHPVKGSYSVPELGLYDVSFTEVLRAVRKLYEEKQKVSV